MRALLVAFLATLAALLAGVVQGQIAPPEPLPDRHELVVEGASLRLHEAVDTARMVPGEPLGNSCADGAPDGDFTTGEGGRSFTFLETTGTGCAAIEYNVTLPARASNLIINFTADRRITADTDIPMGEPAFVQQFALRFADGSLRISPFFSPEQGSQDPTVFTFSFAIAPPSDQLLLSWYFREESTFDSVAISGDPGRGAMASTISAIQLEFTGMPLAEPLSEVSAAEVKAEDGKSATLWHWVNVTVPEGAVGPGRSSDVVLEIRRGPTLVAREGPAGLIESERFEASRIGNRILYVIDSQSTSEQGAGAYSFQFQTTRSLPPSEPAPPPTRILAFFSLMLFLPAPAAGLSLYSALVYRREAEGRYRRASTAILSIVLLGVAYYLLLAAYSLLGAGYKRMTTLPLASTATAVYIQLFVLLLLFVVSAVVVGRYMARAMRHDIEARKQQEDKLRRSNEELERFAYVASHDLQEPLRKVAGFTSLLQRRYKGRLDKEADEMIQYAVDGATRMQALIRDILAYSRVGSNELDLRPVEVGAVMELVVSDLGEKIKNEKAHVVWDALPTVEADAGQVRQILQNLVENAVKYRHPSRGPRVRVSAARDEKMWRFTVTDNGIGIPADKLTDIFGIFRRLHGNEIPGTGIGLAMAKKAVERHGGTIWVESRAGKGTTFHFTLPAVGELGAPPPWRTSMEGGKGQKDNEAAPA